MAFTAAPGVAALCVCKQECVFKSKAQSETCSDTETYTHTVLTHTETKKITMHKDDYVETA